MNAHPPEWGCGSRFFLPNEDAAVVCGALKSLDRRVCRPVFVGGSGMVLLEAAATLPELEQVTFVDIAPFQLHYFQELLRAVTLAKSPESLREWFGRAVYPALRDHYRLRGQEYEPDQVMNALKAHFGVTFFFDPETLDRVRNTVDKTGTVRDDIVSYLGRQEKVHDFIYLSNVADYLPETAMKRLFAACRTRLAPVYLLVTSACPDREGLRLCWESAGYAPHPASDRLDRENRGLGSTRLDKRWNRPGSIRLLVPACEETAYV